MSDDDSNVFRRAPLPDPGPGRWWEVKLATGLVVQKPLRVTLYESFDGARANGGVARRPGRALMSGRSAASAQDLGQVALKILNEVGAYQDYIGEYYIEPRRIKPGPKKKEEKAS